LNGIQRLKRAFASRKYLITREVWERGETTANNSLRKALMSYGWDSKEQPKKDGREDPLDALRYDCVAWNWNDLEVDARRYVRAGVERKVRTGSAKARSF